MKNIEQRIKNLSSERQKLLRRLLKTRQAVSAASQPILPRITSGSYTPSFAQQRLWFLHQLEPNVPMYNMPRALKIQGNLDIQVLRQALETLIERHETLRTTFTAVNGEPVATILSNWSFDLPLHDFSHLSESQCESEVHRLIQQEVRRPFDLEHELMLRGVLFQMHDTEYILLLVKHHIATDAWSSGVLNRELGLLYDGFAQGLFVTLPDLPITYADFAVWQREWLQGERLQALLTYWKHQLVRVPKLKLPTDHPYPAIQTYRSASQSCRLSERLIGAVTLLSRKEGVTVFMTLLAAFTILLSRYTGQTDITIGTPIANRRRPEFEGLIGFFVNTLVLRIDLSGNPTFQELLQRVKTITLDAHEHQDLPFERLVEELQVERNLHSHPLFQALFDFVNTPAADLHLSGVTVEPFPVEQETSGFDMILYIRGKGNNLSVECAYATDVFETSTITRLLGHFRILLKEIVAHPTQHISELLLLTKAERHQILVEWNASQTDYPKNVCIHQLFEAQVERTPDAIAVVFEDQQLTYREINTRANQLAHYLRRYDIGPETCIGICVERSLGMIVGLLGILKAGGAYAPIDLSYPIERIAQILEDCQAPIILTQHHLVEKFHVSGNHIICVDSDWEDILQESHENPINRTCADNMSYILYTSGSTGPPKGTIVTHHNVLRLFQATASWYHFHDRDVWTLFHSYAFDFSVWELWGALLYGGRLVIAPYWMSRNPETFYKKLCREQVTVLNQTPSAFYQLVWFEEQAKPQKNLVLRLVIFGGEPLEIQRLNPWFERHGDLSPQLINMYGITETTVHVTYHRLKQTRVRKTPGSVIGRPIPDLQIYILDHYFQPVPVGIPGELYVGGEGVARNYLNHQALTAERFIPNPFSGRPGTRLYRTGDLGCYLPDGRIEFLERIDHQVKIRGFRVELGEIESVLRHYPSVQEAIVLLREDTPDNKCLVAYIVLAQTSAPSIEELRQFLTQKLPEYMIPSAFVLLDEFPLTPNGKIDRKTLPEPGQTRPDLKEQFIPPRTTFEQKLAQIWCEVLHLAQVGIHDNFFVLGGHSLLATQIISRMNRAFDMEIPLRSLFETPTVAGLTETVTRKQLEKFKPDEIKHLLAELE